MDVMQNNEVRRPTGRTRPVLSLLLCAATMIAAGHVSAGASEPAALRPAASTIIAPPPAEAPRLRGLVVARHQATISAAIAATITAIGPEVGERFRRGDRLVAFDCGIYDAELARARAIVEAAADAARVKRTLASSGSTSGLQAVLAEAELKKANADAIVAEARVAYCAIRAPFDGRVVRRIANAFETVNPRDPLIEIVDDGDNEVRLFMPSAWIAHTAPGTRLAFEVDETGEIVDVEVVALGAVIDNVSQLLEVRGRPLAGADRLLPGMSGRATLRRRP